MKSFVDPKRLHTHALLAETELRRAAAAEDALQQAMAMCADAASEQLLRKQLLAMRELRRTIEQRQGWLCDAAADFEQSEKRLTGHLDEAIDILKNI